MRLLVVTVAWTVAVIISGCTTESKVCNVVSGTEAGLFASVDQLAQAQVTLVALQKDGYLPDFWARDLQAIEGLYALGTVVWKTPTGTLTVQGAHWSRVHPGQTNAMAIFQDGAERGKLISGFLANISSATTDDRNAMAGAWLATCEESPAGVVCPWDVPPPFRFGELYEGWQVNFEEPRRSHLPTNIDAYGPDGWSMIGWLAFKTVKAAPSWRMDVTALDFVEYRKTGSANEQVKEAGARIKAELRDVLGAAGVVAELQDFSVTRSEGPCDLSKRFGISADYGDPDEP